jgi:TetR/AcrR family transcriptional repressor of mexJK operon
MAIETGGKVLREGSAKKRADILAAARTLFLEDGFDRTSVDAISALANVSKRTVYDYFGDKKTLLIAVLKEGGSALMETIRDAIDDNLRDVTDIERALTDFALRISQVTIGSVDYRDLMKLLSKETSNLPAGPLDQLMDDQPEDAVAERFAEFNTLGLLDAPNARLAADHFVALTVGMTVGGYAVWKLDEPAARQVIVDGVGVFLRAYAPTGSPAQTRPPTFTRDRG